jgi:ABC-type dipeptide/oligopeptide/nickel transport system ATPase component
MSALVEIRGLTVSFPQEDAPPVDAVRSVDLDLPAGKTLALVGESGSGKSTLALALLGLLPASAQVRGTARFGATPGSDKSIDLLALDPRGEPMRAVRGRRIAMIFQEPALALNPVYTLGEQVAESLRLHRHLGRREARQAAVAALNDVGIPDPARIAGEVPYELSGGMRQRAMIAMALAGVPELLLADEPTASLDVTVQAEILDLLRRKQAASGMAVLLVTHDFGVVAEMADEVAVMLRGEVVERGEVEGIFHRATHPYTKELIRAVTA